MRILPFTALLLATSAASAAPVDHCGQITGTETTSPVTGNTVASFGNDYDVQICAGNPGAGWIAGSGQSTEQVFAVRVQSDCTLTVTTVGQSSGGNLADPAIYATTSCPAETASTIVLDSTCRSAADANGQLGTETLSFAAQAGRTYYLFMDGYLAAQGPYSTSLSGCTLIEAALFGNGFES
jgi:hypothetical protein